ncbi:hypothetical protein GIB67_015184 [Kingdonia uniflora]|uniref:Cytochrome P450 n=1 Tax=Kingdonia uniflora TaxID=39325 RepID=A0A7J7LJJ5_9MAGN|nr:hypothetical protein GIB67_015184 [Kingdonia uniflora]
MEKFQSLQNSASCTIASFSLLFITILIIINRRRRNWRNAPPGPKGWPILGYLPYLSDHLHEDLFHLAKTYGPLFSLCLGQKPAIVISSPEVARVILRDQDATFSSRTINEVVRCIAYDATTTVFVPYGSRWRLLRKIMKTEIFSSRAIEVLQPARTQQVQKLLRMLYLASKTKTSVNIADTMFIHTANIISNLVCSKSLFNNEMKEGRELKTMFSEILEIIAVPNLADLIPCLKPFDPQGLKRKILKLVNKFDSFFEKLLDDRLQERKYCEEIHKSRSSDLLDVLFDYKSDKEEDLLKQFSRIDIKGMLADMFMAGTDTTPSTIEWGMAEILRHPEIHKKVVSELEEVVGKNRFVEETDIPKLIYFQAVIKEVFRLHPGLPVLIPRRSDKACEIYGYHVPKNTIVFVNVWGISRDPNIWAEPNEFKPERFLWKDMDVKGQDFELLPFGAGRRSCVGMPLGLLMLQHTVASMLHAFDWEFSAGSLNDTTEKVGVTVQKAKSLIGVPTPRHPNLVYQY